MATDVRALNAVMLTSRQDIKALIEAASNGELERVRSLLERGVDVHVENDGPLRVASENGHLAVVRCLIAAGANVRVGVPACREDRVEQVDRSVVDGGEHILVRGADAVVQEHPRDGGVVHDGFGKQGVAPKA